MLNILKSSVVWQFAAGFMLGAVGLAAMHPADSRPDVAPTVIAQR